MLNSVKLIELEIHGKCNRSCSFCCKRFDKYNTDEVMSDEVYLKIIKDLEQVKYSEMISFSRNNEVLLYTEELKRKVNIIKDRLPNATLVASTNGDYLSKDALKDLNLDKLVIKDYDCMGREKCYNILYELGVDIVQVYDTYIEGKLNNMQIIYIVDFTKNELLEVKNDKSTDDYSDINSNNCTKPIEYIGIDLNGNVSPCCQIHTDNQLHQVFILGNVKDNNLDHIFNSSKAVGFRNYANIDNKKAFPCNNCSSKLNYYKYSHSGIKFKKNIKY